MRLTLPFFLMAAIMPAQMVSIGIKAGGPVTDAVPSYGSIYSMVDTGRWTIGPSVELRLFSGLSVEADALYRGYRRQLNFVSTEAEFDGIRFPAISNSTHENTKVWDFPLLLKYRFGGRRYRPFITAGATLSHASSDVTSSLVCLSSESVCSGSYFRDYYNAYGRVNSTRNSAGPTAGLGVEFKAGRFKLAPEVRYTHFGTPARNQASVIMGFSF
jgi:hypothetical protein